MRFVWNRFSPLIPRSSIPSASQGNDAGQSRTAAALGPLWNCKTSIPYGRCCRSLHSFSLTMVTIWMITRTNSDAWPTGLSARTLIGEPSIIAWLNIVLARQERKEVLMRIRVQVLIESDQEATPSHVEEVACFERDHLSPETLGLRLEEAKQLLAGVQQVMTAHQIEEYVEQQCQCSHCEQLLAYKGHHQIGVRTLFGKLTLSSPRLYTCPCQPRTSRSWSPVAALFPERSTPELLYQEARWASLLSYGVTVKFLGDLLPMEHQLSTSTITRHVHQVAERLESELGDEQPSFIEGCPDQWYKLPEPAAPLVFSLDGGYVHAHSKESHITMRLTVLHQMVKGVTVEQKGEKVEKELERVKWFLWHSNMYKALQLLEWLELDIDEEASPEARKLARTLHEFDHYIRTNQSSIPNYGDRYRNGEAISSAVAESSVNQMISKRFVKKQQMRWTKRGAHLLLQV